MGLKNVYFTISQAAGQLGVTRQTVSRWIAEGRFPADKVGREVLINRNEVLNWESQRLAGLVREHVIRKLWNFLVGDWSVEEAEIEVLETHPDGSTVFSIATNDGRRLKTKIDIRKVEVNIDEGDPSICIEYEEDTVEQRDGYEIQTGEGSLRRRRKSGKGGFFEV